MMTALLNRLRILASEQASPVDRGCTSTCIAPRPQLLPTLCRRRMPIDMVAAIYIWRAQKTWSKKRPLVKAPTPQREAMDCTWLAWSNLGPKPLISRQKVPLGGRVDLSMQAGMVAWCDPATRCFGLGLAAHGPRDK